MTPDDIEAARLGPLLPSDAQARKDTEVTVRRRLGSVQRIQVGGMSRPTLHELDSSSCEETAEVTVVNDAGDPVFYIHSGGKLLATAQGRGGGRMLSDLAFRRGAQRVDSNFDLAIDEVERGPR